MELDAKIPAGPIETLWDKHKFNLKLVNPANKRKYNIIMVGSGLAGGSAAATLGELGYNVQCFCFQDSPRRAHSIAAQGGINAAKNYHGDGDSIYRLFYDTVKGGDFRAREANVYRLAQISVSIIDQCVAQGVPFAREYGGMRRGWFGRIIDRYRGTGTRIVFVRLPRGPIPRPAWLARKTSSSIREMAERPDVMLGEEHAYESLERPEFFKDGMHMNREGVKRFSAMLPRDMARLLGPAR